MMHFRVHQNEFDIWALSGPARGAYKTSPDAALRGVTWNLQTKVKKTTSQNTDDKISREIDSKIGDAYRIERWAIYNPGMITTVE